jgi:hypothetical protein
MPSSEGRIPLASARAVTRRRTAYRIALSLRRSQLGHRTVITTGRLTALRSVVRVVRQIGQVSWSLEVEGPRSIRHRETTGPDLPAVVDAWPELPEAIKAGILAIIKAAKL